MHIAYSTMITILFEKNTYQAINMLGVENISLYTFDNNSLVYVQPNLVIDFFTI